MILKYLPAFVTGMMALGTPIFGGVHVGNGGDAVVCYTDSTLTTLKNVQLLDYFEATKVLSGMAPELGGISGPGDSYYPMIEHVILRVKRQNPGLAGQVKTYIDDFIARAKFIDDGALVDVNDSFHVVLPHNCQVKQIALQRTPRFPEESRYLIDESLFHRLELSSRAMLAIHEALYRIALEHGQVNSINVRYLNAYLSSARPDHDSKQKFEEVLAMCGIGIEFWYDEINGRYWSLHEKGIETPNSCFQLAGQFYAPSVRELQAYLPEVLLSPLARFIFANHNQATIWSGDWDGHHGDCAGNGTNAYKTLNIAVDSPPPHATGHQCMGTTGPFLLCLEK